MLSAILERDGNPDLLEEGLRQLMLSGMSVQNALRRHGLKESIEWWFWRNQCAEAPMWSEHPRQKIGLEFWARTRQQDKAPDEAA